MLKLYNTLTKEKEKFKSLKKGVAKIYSCGPTVYSYAHIGNLRTYLFLDTLKRVLKFNDYKLEDVMNITDVGHLTSDADEGDDKMEVAAKKENKSPTEIANYYTAFFLEDLEKLNIERAKYLEKATLHIKDMIEFVQGLIDNGYAYEKNGSVYYDVDKYSDYGKLRGVSKEDMLAGARVEVNSDKKHPYDFALWVKANKNHLQKWDSPWGVGYPGWHIECSAIGKCYLGDEFDIHTGAVDLIPTHHENEIAQSYGLSGKLPAKYWMHSEFMLINNGKMSKSKDNFYTITGLEKKGYHALDFRYFCLNAHYRKELNFTFEGLDSAKIARAKLNKLVLEHKLGEAKINNDTIKQFETEFVNAINDDINVSKALGVLWKLVKLERSKDVYNLILKMDTVFGLKINKLKPEEKTDIPEEIKMLAEKRIEAKKEKNYSKADELREEIIKKGYQIKDLPNSGFEITKTKKERA